MVSLVPSQPEVLGSTVPGVHSLLPWLLWGPLQHLASTLTPLLKQLYQERLRWPRLPSCLLSWSLEVQSLLEKLEFQVKFVLFQVQGRDRSKETRPLFCFQYFGLATDPEN